MCWSLIEGILVVHPRARQGRLSRPEELVTTVILGIFSSKINSKEAFSANSQWISLQEYRSGKQLNMNGLVPVACRFLHGGISLDQRPEQQGFELDGNISS
jgi:hypothetical protein